MSLFGLRVALTRPEGLNEAWQEVLASAGVLGLSYPMLHLEPNQRPLPEAFSKADGWIFISPSAVQLAWPQLKSMANASSLRKIAAIGQGTARVLRQHGVAVDYCPVGEGDARRLLDVLPDLKGQTWGLVQGEGGRDLLAMQLQERGAEVVLWALYRRVPNLDCVRLLLNRLDQLDAIVLSSSETVRLLFAQAGESEFEQLQSKAIVVIHPRIGDVARECGAKTVLLAEDANVLLGVLSDFFVV